MSQITAEQRDVLAEIGHFHLMLDSHQTAARFCRDQLRKLRQRLAETEAAAAQATQPAG